MSGRAYDSREEAHGVVHELLQHLNKRCEALAAENRRMRALIGQLMELQATAAQGHGTDLSPAGLAASAFSAVGVPAADPTAVPLAGVVRRPATEPGTVIDLRDSTLATRASVGRRSLLRS